MLKVGVTGGIGSGKTTVCRIFEVLGIPVYYSDERSKALLNTDVSLMEQLRSRFGHDIYTRDGVIDRRKLGARVFADEAELNALNALVHPAVFKDFDNWALLQRAPYVLKEAAILFESGSYLDCDYTILVKAPAALRMERVMLRDGLTGELVQQRMDRQMSEEEKERMADLFINNDGKELLIPQVLRLHELFMKKAGFNG